MSSIILLWSRTIRS